LIRASLTASTSDVPRATSLWEDDNDELNDDKSELEDDRAAEHLLVKAGKASRYR